MDGPDLQPLGDRAWLARFPSDDRAAAWAVAVREKSWPGVLDVVAAFRSAAVFADPDVVGLDDLAARLREVPVLEGGPRGGRLAVVPVLYDGEDLPEVSDRVGLTVDEVIARHAAVEYAVRAIGFLPGFPYLGELPEPLAGLPRRASPRPRVPAGSVAITGQQTGIYPIESPGGWNLIGRTPLVIADASLGHFPLGPGDRVRFEPIDEGRFRALLGRRLELGLEDAGGVGP